jgi:hypothetical protein
MRFLAGVSMCALGIAAFAAAPMRADAAFSDALCPEATQFVVALSELRPAPPLGSVASGDPPQKIYETAHSITDAYDICAKRHLAAGDVEPGVHYAYMRGASFGIIEARALIALGRPGDAKTVLQNSKRLAQDVVDWRRSVSQNGSIIGSSGKDTRPSLYRDAAKEIVTAVDDALAKLNAPSAAPAGPAFTPPPKASPSR